MGAVNRPERRGREPIRYTSYIQHSYINWCVRAANVPWNARKVNTYVYIIYTQYLSHIYITSTEASYSIQPDDVVSASLSVLRKKEYKMSTGLLLYNIQPVNVNIASRSRDQPKEYTRSVATVYNRLTLGVLLAQGFSVKETAGQRSILAVHNQ